MITRYKKNLKILEEGNVYSKKWNVHVVLV